MIGVRLTIACLILPVQDQFHPQSYQLKRFPHHLLLQLFLVARGHVLQGLHELMHLLLCCLTSAITGISFFSILEVSSLRSFYSEVTPFCLIAYNEFIHPAQRMVQLAEATARVMGRSGEDLHLIRLAALLNDIGKIGVPNTILHKPGPLTEEEWAVMSRHPEIGRQVLVQAGGIFVLLSRIVGAHQERWDGSGYPYGLAREAIPLGARILSVVDAYDAMISQRPYREALPEVSARAELQRCAGSQFDPQVVDAFLRGLNAQEQPAEYRQEEEPQQQASLSTGEVLPLA